MSNAYRHIIKGLDPLKIPGTLTDVISKGKPVKIKRIYTFQSLRKNFPFLYFEGKKDHFLGIVLARQSSDFLVRLFQKKVHPSFPPMKLIQYRFPNDLHSLKLIAFLKWDKLSDFETLSMDLQKLQAEYIKKLDAILI